MPSKNKFIDSNFDICSTSAKKADFVIEFIARYNFNDRKSFSSTSLNLCCTVWCRIQRLTLKENLLAILVICMQARSVLMVERDNEVPMGGECQAYTCVEVFISAETV